jgi:predicted O-methyltransferase YrrM
MKNKNLLILAILNLSLTSSINYSFNVSYDGNDAEISYQLHEPTERERFVKEDYIKYFPYYKKYVETIRISSPYTINIHSLPYPYCTLSQILPFFGGGMYFNYEFIKKIFKYNKIVNVVEIGALYGLSTRHIATLLPENGKIYTIDPWDYHEGMYEQFLSNVVLSGLTSKIVPIRKRSDQALIDNIKPYENSLDLIFVDGDHETEGVLTDLKLYYPLVKNTGVICGDDWLLKSVRAAVELFAQQNNLTIYAACNFWFLRDEGEYKHVSLIDADETIWMFNK